MATATRHPTQTQTCPECNGTCSPLSVSIGHWLAVVQAGFPVALERKVTFRCEHCGHFESRTETRRTPAMDFAVA